MFEKEVRSLLNSPRSLKNPEIHHYNLGSHPGVSWYIKTVIPISGRDWSENRMTLFWKTIELQHGNIVRISNVALDWYGNTIDGWGTVWLDRDVDIVVKMDESTGNVSHVLTDYNSGLNESGARLLEWINQQGPTFLEELGKLQDVAAFLSTFTGKTKSTNKRKKIKVL